MLGVLSVVPAIAGNMPTEPAPSQETPQVQQSRPHPRREHWVRTRIVTLQQRHEEFRDARFSAKLGGYREDGMPLPYRQTQADREAIRKFLEMKRQHQIDQFELKALQRELQRRSERQHP